MQGRLIVLKIITMFNLKNKTIYLAIAIFFIGIFLRTYHFTDWLHFELDQARDVFIISDAIDGTRDLPLLGPQARGRELQLGPIFYYFQFFSAKIFGATPVTVVFPDLLFSILTIPLSYFFARKFFSKKISFLLFTVTSFSYFLIVYGRFAWNPNSMPFWSMLAAYALLKTADFKDDKNKLFNCNKNNNKSIDDCKKAFCPCGEHNFYITLIFNLKNWFVNKFFASEKVSWWFVTAVLATSVLAQLHFIAFLCFPIVFIVYFIFSKMRISWKTELISLVVICLLFFPVIINEYKTKGHNTKGLIASVTEDRNDSHDLIEKTFRSFQETSTFYFTIFTGDQHGRDLLITKKKTLGYFPLICDKDCKSRLPYLISAIVFFLISLATFIFYIFKGKIIDKNFFRTVLSFKTLKIFKGKYFQLTKGFLRSIVVNLFKNKSITFLIIPWLVMGGLFLTLVAYQISPRFFLFMYSPFLILLGSLLYFIERFFARLGKFIMMGLVIFFVAMNLYNIKIGFTELDDSRNENIEPSRDLVMKRSDRVTLGQLKDIADYISKNEKDNDNTGKIVVGDNRYSRAIYYLVNSKMNGDVLSCYIKRGGFEKESVQNRNFYDLVREKTATHVNDEMLENH